MKKTVIGLLLAVGILAALGQAGGRFIAQWQNAGTLIGTFTSFMRMNCSTGLTCTYSGGTVTMTASGTSGAMVQLETHTAASSATLDFTTCISGTTYRTYRFLLRNVLPASTNALQMQVSTDGGGTFQAGSAYNYGGTVSTSGGATGFGVEGTSLWQISGSTVLQTASVSGASGELNLYNPLGGAIDTNLTGYLGYYSGASAETYSVVFANWNAATAVNAVRFKFPAGNIASGVITCYGITP